MGFSYYNPHDMDTSLNSTQYKNLFYTAPPLTCSDKQTTVLIEHCGQHQRKRQSEVLKVKQFRSQEPDLRKK